MTSEVRRVQRSFDDPPGDCPQPPSDVVPPYTGLDPDDERLPVWLRERIRAARAEEMNR